MRITNVNQLTKLKDDDIIYEVMPKGIGIKHFMFVCEHPLEKGTAILSRGYLRGGDLHKMSEQILKSNLHYLTTDQNEACNKYID